MTRRYVVSLYLKCFMLYVGLNQISQMVILVSGQIILCCDLDDARDTDRCRLALIRQINSVSCLFGKLDPVVKMQNRTEYFNTIVHISADLFSLKPNCNNNNKKKIFIARP